MQVKEDARVAAQAKDTQLAVAADVAAGLRHDLAASEQQVWARSRRQAQVLCCHEHCAQNLHLLAVPAGS